MKTVLSCDFFTPPQWMIDDDAYCVEVVTFGKMRGAHGQPAALLWVVLTDGSVLFHDTARGIPARATGPGEGAACVRASYILGYDYDYDSRAQYLGVIS